ncbi:FAD-dependent oxidoreductase [Pseudonocardia spinosispora]|uniref:FAD-dependent oxidoreductase n=1 Tax=Pseudonocardia spinosispora TaxID=103441 RepID=UPI000400BC94|nr:FAD-dependent monooxygenase [Pseudonocardia spinosispora]
MSVRTAEIVGAGFAGLTAAAALARRGWSVRVHESASELRAFGAGIFLWENGLRVLAEIGALDRVLEGSYEAPSWDDRTADGELMAAIPMPLPGGGRMVTMTRHHLHTALVECAEAAGATILTGRHAAGADPEGRLWFSDGAVTADVVIGADGIKSAVRDSLGLPARLERFDVGVYRVLVDRKLAPDHSMWRHYVNFWDTVKKRRILYVPCAGDSLYLLLGAKADDTEALRVPFDRSTWQASYPLLADAIGGIADNPRFDYYERVTLTSWRAGRVFIVGDAAHAMPPTLGQGAGTAMGNAFHLAVCLDSFRDVETAGRAWERDARPDTDTTQQVSVNRLEELFPEQGARLPEHWKDDEVGISRRVPRTVHQ